MTVYPSGSVSHSRFLCVTLVNGTNTSLSGFVATNSVVGGLTVNVVGGLRAVNDTELLTGMGKIYLKEKFNFS